ncbi:MAG TPA: glycosyl hydrolase 115 family protein [Terracidiphilus sp.]|nr:glycosyl hydrolase 115 family protein [Terracidiphilus sp.]
MPAQHRRFLFFVLLFAVAALPGWAVPASASIKVEPRTVAIVPTVTVVESPEEPAAVQRATQDLLNDFSKVFSQRPKLVNKLEDAGPVALLIAGRGQLPGGAPCKTTDNTEAFAFSTFVVEEPGGAVKQHVVCLTGADMRGTIYAIYQFSQSVLGVDPMYLWTGKEPEKRTSIELPVDFTHVFPSPVFRYRGFFINDEDLLSGWRLAPPGAHTGISLEVWDNIFETILRLKGNMIVPGTWIFPDDAQVEAASKRGLLVNQHHATPLGVNAARWPQDVPYNFSTHPEILERAWKDAVAEYKPDDDILWSVGLRGLSDQTYADLDPSVRNNDPLLGERISTAIADQIKIVRARFPDAHFIANLWQEGDRLKREGYLKIPPEVTQVWADTGYGDMQDGGDLEPGEGMYFHVAMENGQANQLSEMVPVSVIQEQMERYIKAGATGFFLLNTSDIRPVAMTARAAMETAWGGVPASRGSESGAAGDTDSAYYRKWAAEEFGARSADALESAYKEYFAAPIPRGGVDQFQKTKASNVPREYGEQHYFTETNWLILNHLSGNQVELMLGQSPKWSRPYVLPQVAGPALEARIKQDVDECEAAQPRWDRVWNDALAAEKLVDPARRDYYEAEMLTMTALNREGNRMLLAIAHAMQDDAAGHAQQAEAEVTQAQQAIETMQKYMADAEYGKWKNWYRGDWLTGVHRTSLYVEDYADYLKDPLATLPAPILWNDWEAYHHIMEYEGNRTVDVQSARGDSRANSN